MKKHIAFCKDCHKVYIAQEGFVCPSCGKVCATSDIRKREGGKLFLFVYLAGLTGYVLGTVRSLLGGIRVYPALFQNVRVFIRLILETIANVLVFAVISFIVMDLIWLLVLRIRKKYNKQE